MRKRRLIVRGEVWIEGDIETDPIINHLLTNMTASLVRQGLDNLNILAVQDKSRFTEAHRNFTYSKVLTLRMFPRETFNIIDVLNIVLFPLPLVLQSL